MTIQTTFANGNNPFTHMAGSLGARPVPNGAPADSQAKPLSRTETIRRHLRETGTAMTSEEIAFDLDDALPNFGSHLV